jgi:hypothetical protein
MVTKNVEATGTFSVTVDETKFTQAFFEEFSKYMHEMDCVDDAIKHLAGLYARGVIDSSTKFIEGYGDVADMGIKFKGAYDARAFIDVPVDIEIVED